MKRWLEHPGPRYCEFCKGQISRAHGRFPVARFCSINCRDAFQRGDPDALLWSKIDKKHPSGCWVYKGATDRRGYGRPAKPLGGGDQRRYYAHRRVYELMNGPIPLGKLVLHKCDNPPCCNPDHLFLGSDADNANDKSAKGRALGRLTADSVRQIRSRLAAGWRRGMNVELAREFGCHAATISAIKAGRIYRFFK